VGGGVRLATPGRPGRYKNPIVGFLPLRPLVALAILASLLVGSPRTTRCREPGADAIHAGGGVACRVAA
jgi:hypothetical protein